MFTCVTICGSWKSGKRSTLKCARLVKAWPGVRGVWNTRRNTRKETTGTRVGMEFTKKDIRAWGGGKGGGGCQLVASHVNETGWSTLGVQKRQEPLQHITQVIVLVAACGTYGTVALACHEYL